MFPQSTPTSCGGGSRARDNEQFESAFWELYLHEPYLRSGYGLPSIPRSPGRLVIPTFLLRQWRALLS
jgi:hypothetical protein